MGPSKFEASFRCGEPLCFRSWKPCPTINCYPGCVSGSREIWSSATKLGTWKPVPATPAAKRCHSPRQPGWHSLPQQLNSIPAGRHRNTILWPSNQTPTQNLHCLHGQMLLKQTASRENMAHFETSKTELSRFPSWRSKAPRAPQAWATLEAFRVFAWKDAIIQLGTGRVHVLPVAPHTHGSRSEQRTGVSAWLLTSCFTTL